jgi:hypothetical protein
MLLSNPRVLVDISGGGYMGAHNPGYTGLRVCRTNLLSVTALTPCSLHTGSHVVLFGYESERDGAASPHLYTGLFQIDDAGDCLQANPAAGESTANATAAMRLRLHMARECRRGADVERLEHCVVYRRCMRSGACSPPVLRLRCLANHWHVSA